MRCSIFKREFSSPSLSAPSLTIQTPQHRPGGAEQPTQLHRHTAAQLSGQVDDALCHARRAAARRARSAAGRAAPATSLSGCSPHTLARAGNRRPGQACQSCLVPPFPTLSSRPSFTNFSTSADSATDSPPVSTPVKVPVAGALLVWRRRRVARSSCVSRVRVANPGLTALSVLIGVFRNTSISKTAPRDGQAKSSAPGFHVCAKV